MHANNFAFSCHDEAEDCSQLRDLIPLVRGEPVSGTIPSTQVFDCRMLIERHVDSPLVPGVFSASVAAFGHSQMFMSPPKPTQSPHPPWSAPGLAAVTFAEASWLWLPDAAFYFAAGLGAMSPVAAAAGCKALARSSLIMLPPKMRPQPLPVDRPLVSSPGCAMWPQSRS